MSKKPKDEEVKLNTHTYRCEQCGAEFGVMYMGNGPLAVELQEQTASVIGWHSVTGVRQVPRGPYGCAA